MRILLIEDDELVADAVVRGLTLAGFTVDHAASAELGRAALAEHFDLAVIDIGLPGADGLTLLAALRGEGRTMPVLMLTARDTLADKIRAFNLGADDFLMKPFEQAELAARCRALIRRASLSPSGIVRLGRLTIDLNGHQLQVDEHPVELTRREWLVLETLAHNLGRIVTKERLMQALAGWEQDLTPNAVETHISRLRGKLGSAVQIRAVRGLGYRLDEVGAAPP
ncbi:MAG TPA: response regulator transcription factor [Steroidobacteraceae bacterium]|jgi:DNA-binding response OmpR family regulator|nr:response regulator transcription factor [Steroidobacteraceae bacterium]